MERRQRLLFVYDYEGNSVCTVNQEMEDCYFGDGTYLIGQIYDSERQKSITCILEVSDCMDGKADWVFLE